MVDKFGEGRVFVAGGKLSTSGDVQRFTEVTDAAHAHSPAGGQVCGVHW